MLSDLAAVYACLFGARWWQQVTVIQSQFHAGNRSRRRRRRNPKTIDSCIHHGKVALSTLAPVRQVSLFLVLRITIVSPHVHSFQQITFRLPSPSNRHRRSAFLLTLLSSSPRSVRRSATINALHRSLTRAIHLLCSAHCHHCKLTQDSARRIVARREERDNQSSILRYVHQERRRIVHRKRLGR